MRESTNTAEVYWEASAILLRKNLKHILRTLGYQTFERFAHEHQIPKSTLSQLIHHTRNPRLSTMDAVAKALGVSLSALFSLPQPLPPDWKDL
jgi:DNA-binding phage protein